MSDLSDAIAIAVSFVALSLSVYSVWRSSISPFRLQCLASTPTLTIYAKAAPEGGPDEPFVAYEPSIDCAVTLYNSGARTGVLNGLRLLATIETERGPIHGDFKARYLQASAPVDATSPPHGILDSSAQIAWYDLLMAGGREIHLSAIFRLPDGSYWTRPEAMRISLEFQTLSTMRPGWTQVTEFLMLVPSAAFGTGSRTAVSVRSDNQDVVEQLRSTPFVEIDTLPVQT